MVKSIINSLLISIMMLGGCTTFAETYCQENHVEVKNIKTGESTVYIMLFLKEPEFDIHHSYCFKEDHGNEIDCSEMEKAISDAFNYSNYSVVTVRSGKLSCLK